jgi:hypothetical protein
LVGEIVGEAVALAVLVEVLVALAVAELVAEEVATAPEEAGRKSIAKITHSAGTSSGGAISRGGRAEKWPSARRQARQ